MYAVVKELINMKCETCGHKDVCRFIDAYKEAVENFENNDYLEVSCKKYEVPVSTRKYYPVGIYPQVPNPYSPYNQTLYKFDVTK